MKLIGLTGGIGSGKSTVSDYLIAKGYPVLDADKISREIVEPGSPVLKNLAAVFGEGILQRDGSLDRKGLSAIVFSDGEKRRMMEEIMHREVIRITLKRAEAIADEFSEPVVFIDAPLLFEANVDRYTEQNWVVDADDETRIRRVMERSYFSRDEVERRIAHQMSRQERNDRATYVLDNSGTHEELYAQVDKLLERL